MVEAQCSQAYNILVSLEREMGRRMKHNEWGLQAKDLFADASLGYTMAVHWTAESVCKERSAEMLYRQEKQGKIAITQPMHAWLSGQLARAWGNERFGEVVPFEEVCLGAEQHDIAHADWERAPKLNPQTGRPYSFLEAPKTMHIPIFSSASSLVLNQGRYAALLVSLHFTGLYKGYNSAQGTPEDSQTVQAFLAREY